MKGYCVVSPSCSTYANGASARKWFATYDEAESHANEIIARSTNNKVCVVIVQALAVVRRAAPPVSVMNPLFVTDEELGIK